MRKREVKGIFNVSQHGMYQTFAAKEEGLNRLLLVHPRVIMEKCLTPRNKTIAYASWLGIRSIAIFTSFFLSIGGGFGVENILTL